MSKVIDERVVSMQFDNKHFESNVQTTMSTLDKLKAKLNFSGSIKSFDNINAASAKCNLAPLSSAVESVGLKFNAMHTIADQALRRITDSALMAGKRIVNALTIDPVKTGLQEYETQINSVQTILANTEHQGTTIKDVNKALDELNEYADLTIYNFTEMTRNIGTFTAAGLDLETSTKAIQGIANLAAVSGSNSQQASTAMYQLSQALASGTIKLMDWNSVVNAGMGGKVFQNAIIETAKGYGEVAKSAVEAYEKGENFRNLLNPKDYGDWFTSDVLADTLKKFTKSGSVEYLAKISNATEDSLRKLQDLGDTVGYDSEEFDKMAKSIANGDSALEKSIKDVLKMANTATDAATKVKTFTQMWDVMKETAQSGWSQTWKIIFGDFEEAKAIFTPLTNFFTNIIDKISDARNAFLKAALDSPFGQLGEKIAKFTESTGAAADVLGDYSEIVDKVIAGEFGAGQERWDNLSEAGYNWAHAQNLVNERLGNSFRRVVELTEVQDEHVGALEDLTDAKLKDLGLTEAEIAAYRDLERQSKETGKPLSELIEKLETRTGRELLIDSVKNFGSALTSIASAAGKAWREIFDPIKPESLYKKIDAFESFTAGIKSFFENAENLDDLTRVFKGLFAVLDIVKTVVGGGFSLAFKAVSGVLGLFNMDVLDAAAHVGDLLVKLRDWVDEHSLLNKVFDEFGPNIKNGIVATRSWIKETGMVGQAVGTVSDFLNSSASAIINWFKGFGTTDDIFGYVLESIQNGARYALSGIKNLGSTVGKFLKKIFESPLKVIDEFKDKVLDKLGNVGDGISAFIDRIVDFVKRLDISFGGVAAILAGAGIVVACIKFANVFSKVVGVVTNVSDAFAGVGESISGAFKKIGNAAKIIGLAVAIAIIAKAFLELAKLEWEEIGKGVVALVSIAAVLTLLSVILGVMGKKSLEITTGAATLLGIAAAIAILAFALRMVTELNSDNIIADVLAIGGIGAALVLVTAMLSKLAPQISKGSLTMIAIAAAILILVIAVSKIDALNISNPERTILTLIGLISGLALLSAVTKGVTVGSAFGIIGIVAALFIFVGAIERLASIDMVKIKASIEEIAVILGMFAILMLSSSLAGKNAGKAGIGILAMSAALILVIGAIKLIGTISPSVLSRGVDVISQLLLMFGLITAVSLLAGGNAAKAGFMLMEMSLALVLISTSIFILSKIAQNNEDSLNAATNTIMKLIAMFGLIIVASHWASSAMGTLITIGVVLGLLTVALGILSTIPDSDLQSATASLVLIMGALAGLIAVTKLINIGKGSFLKTAGTLIIMTAVIGTLGFIIAKLVALDPGRAMEAASSLALLITSLSASVALLGVAGKFGLGALIGIGSLVVLIAALAGVMAAINAIVDDAEKAEAGLDTAIMVMEKLGTGLGSFIGGIFGGLGAGLFSGLEQMAADLNAFMTEMTKEGGFIEGAKSIDEHAMAGIKTLMSMLMMFAGAEFIGSISSLFETGLTKIIKLFKGEDNPMTTLVDKMTELGLAVTAFSNSTAGLDDTALSRIETVAGICKTLVDLADSIPNEGGWLGKIVGENDMSAFGDKLPVLGAGIVSFAKSVRELTDDDIEKIKISADAAMALAEMASSVPNMGGKLAEFFGENDLSVFGEKLTAFGSSLVAYGLTIRALTEDDIEKIDLSSKAAMGLATMADAVPNMGGKLAEFFGENDLSVFGVKLTAFGSSLVAYGTSIRALTEEDIERINMSAEAAKGLASVADAVPNMGGLLAEAFGENDLSVFGTQISGFGDCLMNYATSVLNLSDEHIASITRSKDAVKALADVARAVPNEGGLIGAIAGENNILGFATGMSSIATCINEYVSKVENIDDETVETIKNSKDAVKQLANIAEETPKLDKDQNIALFANTMPTIGRAISSYVGSVRNVTEDDVDSAKRSTKIVSEVGKAAKSIPGVIQGLSSSNVDLAISNLSKIINFATNVEDVDASGLSSLGETMEKAAKDGINKFIKVFDTKKSDVGLAGKNMVTALANGMESGERAITVKINSLISHAAERLRGGRQSFYDAGAAIVAGFANGISANSYKAVAKVRLMAEAAVSAAREELNINSPSKIFIKIGEAIPEGFVIGINKFGTAIARSTASMGDAAIQGTRYAIARIAEVVDTDIDSQPTIRPVVDLSDVTTGAGLINGLFSMQPSVDLLANVGSVNTMMNRRQNGINVSNGDVVAAIKDLKTVLGNSQGNSYNINGITYDDGSNMADIIKALVRTTRIEGRI